MPQGRTKAEWKTSKFKQEAEAAFKQMKKLIAELPMLTAPKEKEEIIPCSTRARDQLYSHGKAGVSLARRMQSAEKIFPSTHDCHNNGPTNKATIVEPSTAIKGQILADFIVKRPEEESPDELMTEPEELPEPWTLFTDGSSCVDGSGA
ncbi:hypothetical protein Tco_0348725 [Tanacetum coccineum]